MPAETMKNPAHCSDARRARNRVPGSVWGLLAALPAAAWLWGFTVDDALISARVAAHLARGLGSRFNLHGAPVDAVTPLGYAALLAPLGHGDTLASLQAAKWLGLAAWLLAASMLGQLIEDAGRRTRRFAPLAVVAVSAPLAAWSVSGMETGLVTLLATLGLSPGWGGALALGVAAAWRPELVPFAWLLVSLRACGGGIPPARRVLQGALVGLPPLLVVLVRVTIFGRALPLSFYAKPSDFEHGLRYVLGALAFTGLPWLLIALPSELARCAPRIRPMLAALTAHFCALVLCGGDWMTMYRLVVPVLPCAALAGAMIAEQARPWAGRARLALGLVSALFLAIGLGPAARRVGADRLRLMALARPALARDPRVAALDVGWVGALGDAEVIDLAGVTDPQVAFFPGGHTSKRIPAAWLRARRPTAIVLLVRPGSKQETPFANAFFSRAVERRVATLVAGEFQLRTTLALGDQRYVVLEAKP